MDIGKNGCLFRALECSRNGFDDKPITSGALCKRIQKRVQDAGLYEGETLHSFWRSTVQHGSHRVKV
jgi:hypothetical protein